MNWYQNALVEAETYFDDQARSDDELVSITQAAISGFDVLFKDIMREAKIRDEWDSTKCYILPQSTECIQRSTKMDVEFSLGISLYGWFIDCPLSNADHIRSMKDDFWGRIAMLGELGTAEFRNYGRPHHWGGSPESKRLLQHQGSLVFSIARDYTMFELRDDRVLCESLGGIRVTMPLDTLEEDLLRFYRRGLEAMYRINYSLYRSSYLREKRLEKQRENQQQASQGVAPENIKHSQFVVTDKDTCCGLCGKTTNLTKTNCCDEWICDDESNYAMFSYARNSCHRNHRKQTLCAFHHNNGHRGDWTECKECQAAFDNEDYVCYGTNQYNFRKLSNPPEFNPTRCKRCDNIINRMTEGFTVYRGEYFCERCCQMP